MIMEGSKIEKKVLMLGTPGSSRDNSGPDEFRIFMKKETLI